MKTSDYFALPEKDKKEIIKKAIRAANEEQTCLRPSTSSGLRRARGFDGEI